MTREVVIAKRIIPRKIKKGGEAMSAIFTLTNLKADYKNGAVGVEFEDIGDLEELIDNVKSNEKYQIAALAAASANVASKTVAIAT
jgi:filamentous hemagglutinin